MKSTDLWLASLAGVFSSCLQRICISCFDFSFSGEFVVTSSGDFVTGMCLVLYVPKDDSLGMNRSTVVRSKSVHRSEYAVIMFLVVVYQWCLQRSSVKVFY